MTFMGWLLACHLTVGPTESVVSRENVGRRVSFVVANASGRRLRECKFYLEEGQHVEAKIVDYSDGHIRYDLTAAPNLPMTDRP